MGSPQPQPPPQPQPLPTQVTITHVKVATPQGRQQTQLLWQITTPAGTAMFFSDRAFSAQLHQMLAQHLAAWPGELVVPTIDLEQVRAGLGLPNDNGHS